MFWFVKRNKSLAAFNDYKNFNVVKRNVGNFFSIAMSDFLTIAHVFDGDIVTFVNLQYKLNRKNLLKKIKNVKAYNDKYYVKLTMIACRQARQEMFKIVEQSKMLSDNEEMINSSKVISSKSL